MPGDQAAEIMTRAFATREPALFVNVAANGGSVRAELRDVDGAPIPGYEVDNCVAGGIGRNRRSGELAGESQSPRRSSRNRSACI